MDSILVATEANVDDLLVHIGARIKKHTHTLVRPATQSDTVMVRMVMMVRIESWRPNGAQCEMVPRRKQTIEMLVLFATRRSYES